MYKFLFLLLFGLLKSTFAQTQIQWTQLEAGLNYASVLSPVKSTIADSKIDILKIDPNYFSFDLICAGQKKSNKKLVTDWAKENNLIACVNSSMFKLEGDFMTSTGYMKNGKYINNPNLNPAYKSIFAFNPKDSSLPKAHIIDLSCENWTVKKEQYGSFSQSLRMIDCNGKNTWQLQEKKWSMVLLGEDKSGNILFIFVRSPYKVFDYINILQSLPIALTRLMYLEGGPEASFYVNHPKLKLEKMGSYETGFVENDNNDHFWEIPNVIGIRRK
ncbi:MAG TPA: phosphodiester glycosidase family protein [Cytophagaceae bacterium]|jgi:hypothetical protein|nr:phosphodiester glycosidase family protein [Cytophagaceae bacterium]